MYSHYREGLQNLEIVCGYADQKVEARDEIDHHYQTELSQLKDERIKLSHSLTRVSAGDASPNKVKIQQGVARLNYELDHMIDSVQGLYHSDCQRAQSMDRFIAPSSSS